MDATEQMIVDLERRLATTDKELAELKTTINMLRPQIELLTANVTQLNDLAARGRGSLLTLSLVFATAGAMLSTLVAALWRKLIGVE
jgi:prefoldin subunit 5